MTEKPASGDVLLGLIIAVKEELIENVKVRNIICCSDHEMAELRIMREGNKANSRITTLYVRRADFSLLRDLLGIIV